MFETIPLFRLAGAMARHAGTAQAVAAENIANADTPGYAAQRLVPFADLVGTGGGQAMPMQATRAGHLMSGEAFGGAASLRRDVPSDPNGNSVTLETEMLSAAEIKRQHDRALAIYRSGLTILRTAVARR